MNVLKNLNKNYYKKAINTKNALLLDLIYDYLQYSEVNEMRNISALCSAIIKTF